MIHPLFDFSSGEKLGVEYLYVQTGKLWCTVSLDPDQPDNFTEIDMDDALDDEGFEDCEFDSDPTIPLLPRQDQHKTSLTRK